MKVYVLHYYHWDESEIRGVYSEEGMNKEKAKFAKYGKEYIENISSDIEERMNSAYARAKEHFKIADAAYKEGTKEYKSFAKTHMKHGKELKANAEKIKKELEKYSNFNDEDFCNYFMQNEDLSFDEYYVLD